MADFDYSNLTGRPPGRFMQLASLVSRGVRSVQSEVRPYAAQWGQANRIALSSTGPLWVALGDSMTQGIGASAFDRGWVGQLSRELDRAGSHYRIVNLAASGARVTDVLDRQLPALAALGVEPALVTVLIGSNDLVRREHRDALPARFAELLARVPAGTVVANLPNPRRAAREVNALIAAAGVRGTITVADMTVNTGGSWRGKLAADHFHPNDLGYADLAAVFAATILGARRPVR